MYKKGIFILSILLVALVSCSEAPKKAQKPKEAEKPVEPVTGRYAFHQTFAAARTWSQDIETLNLHSINLLSVKHVDGKAAAWQVTAVPRMGRGIASTARDGIPFPSLKSFHLFADAEIAATFVRFWHRW